MPNEYINGLRVVQDGQKSVNLNLSNARRKTYSQLQNMTDEQKKGVIIVEDYPVPEDSDEASVTGDGVKNYKQLFADLYNLIDLSKVTIYSILQAGNMIFHTYSILSSSINFTQSYPNQNGATAERITLAGDSSNTYWQRSRGESFTDIGIEVPTSDVKVTLYYDYYKNLDIHTEYLATNCMYDTNTNVKQKIDADYTSLTNFYIKMVYPNNKLSNVDLNDVTESGVYRLNGSITNSASGNYGVLVVFGVTGEVRQIQMTSGSNNIYTRIFASGSWTNWSLITMT